MEMEIALASTSEFNMKHMFGLSWRISLSKSKTEALIAYWDPRKKQFVQKNWMEYLSI